MRGICTRLSRDDGMTIIEVLIAAAILFIVITALLGLITQSMNTGMQAKQKTVFTNVVNSYIERVQGMDFAKVEVGGDPGQLASTETTTVGGYTIVITPSVAPGATSALKTLTVSATISSANGRTNTMSTTVIIRDKKNFLTQGVTGPQITWKTANMPDHNELVYANLKDSGGLLRLEAEVIAPEGLTVTRVTITADNGWVLESAGTVPELASWDIPLEERQQVWELTGFNWNTEQIGIINAETLEEGPVIPDGLRTIKLRAEDSGGGFSERTYVLLVDNNPPSAPQDLQYKLLTSGPAAGWTTPLDGTTAPASCTVGLNRQSGTAWARTETTGVTTDQVALEPLSRYIVDVTAVGAAPASGAYEARTSATTTMPKSVVTPPDATGSYVVDGNGSKKTYKVSLSVSPLTFAVSGTPTYSWRSSTSPSGPWTTVFATTPTVTGQSYVGALYFRCFVTLTPTAEPDGSAVAPITVASKVLGPTATSGAADLTGQWLP